MPCLCGFSAYGLFVGSIKTKLNQTKLKGQENVCTDAPKRTLAKKFVPPTLEEVKAYCQERGKGVDPQRWIDHYMAKGWMIGKNRMRDWKAAVRTWESAYNNDKSQAQDFSDNVQYEGLTMEVQWLDAREKVILEYQRYIGLRKRQCTQRFENFNTTSGNEVAFNTAKKLAETTSKGTGSGKGVLLVGGVGAGKTHLAAAVVNHVLDNLQISKERLQAADPDSITCTHYWDKIPRIKFSSVALILDDIRRTYDHKSNSSQDVLWEYATAKLLILDDMGTEKLSEWASEQLFILIDHRYCQLLPTVITTNLPPTKLKLVIGDRIFDRVREMCYLATITDSSQRVTAQEL